jgi:Flp pilus assembly protein TadG
MTTMPAGGPGVNDELQRSRPAATAPARPPRDRRGGATALEFGVLVLPFILVMMFILDVAMMSLADSMLDRALHQVAREIKTGQAATKTASQFKTELCTATLGLFSCASNIYLNVQVVNSFSSVSFFNPVNTNGTMKSSFNFAVGTAGDYMLVQGFLKWKSPAAALAYYKGMLSDGSVVLSSAVLFRNEPYK